MTLQAAEVDRETRESIKDFLYRESLALDEQRFRDWLTAFAEDARYEIPVRVTREKLSEWERRWAQPSASTNVRSALT